MTQSVFWSWLTWSDVLCLSWAATGPSAHMHRCCTWRVTLLFHWSSSFMYLVTVLQCSILNCGPTWTRPSGYTLQLGDVILVGVQYTDKPCKNPLRGPVVSMRLINAVHQEQCGQQRTWHLQCLFNQSLTVWTSLTSAELLVSALCSTCKLKTEQIHDV